MDKNQDESSKLQESNTVFADFDQAQLETSDLTKCKSKWFIAKALKK